MGMTHSVIERHHSCTGWGSTPYGTAAGERRALGRPAHRAIGRRAAALMLAGFLGVPGFLAAASCSAGGPPPPSAPSPLLDGAMPDFTRRTVSGERIDTEALRGRVVVIKFFAKYCEPCRRTLPAAERLHRGMEDVAFVGIAIDEYGEDVREMIRAYSLSFPVVHDRATVLAGRYRVREMPVTFVADRDGKIAWVGDASMTEDALRRAIASLR